MPSLAPEPTDDRLPLTHPTLPDEANTVDQPITLQLLGSDLTLDYEELDSERHRLTGRTLRRIRTEMAVTELGKRPVDEALNRAMSEKGYPIPDTVGRSWVVESQYSSRMPGGNWRYDVVLREHEDIHITSLSFGTFTVVPERWRLDTIDDQFALLVLVNLDRATTDRLEHFISEVSRDKSYFTLTGLLETPVEVRFGRCLWEDVGESIRHLLVFVSKEGDSPESQRAGFFDPTITNARRAVVAERRRLNALLEELKSAGLLNEAALNRIEQATKPEGLDTSAREFFRVDRIDDFLEYH